MSYRPEDVERMSMWQFNAACIGWSKQYETGMSDNDADELWDWLQQKNDVALTLRKG